jgi:NitT/TauT family transport system ATP-binding protein
LSSTPVLALDQVQITLGGRLIVEPTSLSIPAGEFMCIVGPSGCGKTTLLRAAAGLIPVTAGAIRLNDQPVVAPSRDVAVVFQDYGKALLPWRTARGNVSLALEAAGTPAAERAERIAAVLSKVGLSDHAEKFPNQLSGGMQQRLQIARCLAQDPRVLMMDEPFGALDALTRQGLQDEVARLVRERAITAVFVTHDLEEAIYLGDRVIAMNASPGRVAKTIQVNLPRPRNQLLTREEPEFLRLRRELFDFIQESH